jgi:hypothetical protein
MRKHILIKLRRKHVKAFCHTQNHLSRFCSKNFPESPDWNSDAALEFETVTVLFTFTEFICYTADFTSDYYPFGR